MKTLLKLVLILSIGSAERAMSVLRRLKNYLRSTMEQNRTSDLALLCMEYNEGLNLNMDEIIDTFAKAKVRRGSRLS